MNRFLKTNTRFWVVSVVAAVVALSGAAASAGGPSYPYGTLADPKKGTLGAFAQWTDNVAVTVGHVPTDSSLFQVECADVKFFAHSGKAPHWAMPALRDEVAAVGNVVVGAGTGRRVEAREAQGTVQELSLLVCDGQVQLLVHDGITKEGMSGGPVYRKSDGAAVGITRGYINDRSNQVEGSVFIPYHTLQAAWELAKKQAPQLISAATHTLD